MTEQDDWAAIDAALGNVRIRFWVCPIGGHSDRKSPDGRPVVTVEWRDGIAHCTHPDCDATSRTVCTVCGSRATVSDGIVGAWLCDSTDCLTTAWDRARSEETP